MKTNVYDITGEKTVLLYLAGQRLVLNTQRAAARTAPGNFVSLHFK